MCPASLGFLNVIAILLCGGQLWSYFNGVKAQEKVCTLALPPTRASRRADGHSLTFIFAHVSCSRGNFPFLTFWDHHLTFCDVAWFFSSSVTESHKFFDLQIKFTRIE